MVRVAIVDYDLCRPDKCGVPCVRFCPINRTRPYRAIELNPARNNKPVINETFCIACGICVKKCPYKAIKIVNLPDEVEKKLVHRYGPNAFKLYGLPTPIRGKVVGVLGRNGIGKTTAVKILSGEIIPNFGNYSTEPSKDLVLSKFRGTELYDYFQRLYSKEIRVVHKPQDIELIRKIAGKAVVKNILSRFDERGLAKDVIDLLYMDRVLDKKIAELSGGELQKLAIAIALCRDANVYVFDEPTSYLDIRERIRVATVIRDLIPRDAYAFVVEHDLVVLDYVSDNIVVGFGEPGVYGMFSKPYSTGSGINFYLEGYLPSENMRIRDEKIVFSLHEVREDAEYIIKTSAPLVEWSRLRKRLDSFVLDVEPGTAYQGEVIGILGPNAIGKTTFVKMLAGIMKPDEGYATAPMLRVSYKPQYLERRIPHCETVEECLAKVNKEALNPNSWLFHEVIKRLNIDRLLPRRVEELSGGELQKFYVSACLIKEADVYLLDEPSTHIDVEDQLSVARAIKRIARIRKAVVFVVDHNLVLLDYAVDRAIVFLGEPTRHGCAQSPKPVGEALNEFLKELNVTFRRDPRTGRPRMNKPGSYLDRYQKSINAYFYSKPVEVREE